MTYLGQRTFIHIILLWS